jgi:hypothetical protein
MARTVSSGACRAVSVRPAARTGLRDKAMGRRSWLCWPGLLRYGARRVQPRARRPSGPHHHGTLPAPGRSLYRPAAAWPGRDKPFGRPRRARCLIGESVAHVAPGSVPGAADRRSSGWLAFSWCRLPLLLGGSFGSESAARGRVDGLVAVVPADPIARRGIAAQHFLNDTRAGTAVR